MVAAPIHGSRNCPRASALISPGEFRGTFVALLTPFTADDQLDEERLRRHVDWLIAEGVHGLIPSGSAGEFLELTVQERERLIEVTIEQAAGRVPVVAGCSADGTAEAQRWVRHAERVGADGVMVAPPFYSLPTEKEIIRHFELVAGAMALPVMAYNNPATTGIDMRPPLLQQLAEIPNVRYVKESTSDVRRVEDIHLRTDGRMTVFAGIHAFESFLVGARGWVSVPANVAPNVSARLYESVVSADLNVARSLSDRLWDLMELEADTGKYVQVYKEALALEGDPVGPARGPRLPLTESERERLMVALVGLHAPNDSAAMKSAR
jgi:4-hydroxy-tetrahydrodipicolinate synthase